MGRGSDQVDIRAYIGINFPHFFGNKHVWVYIFNPLFLRFLLNNRDFLFEFWEKKPLWR